MSWPQAGNFAPAPDAREPPGPRCRAGRRPAHHGRDRRDRRRDRRPGACAAALPGGGGRHRAIRGQGHGPSLRRSLPVSVDIPAIGVHSALLRLGVNADGTIQVPPLRTRAGEAAWYKYSATPGQIGTSVIEGHVDSYQGPAVFFRLGALRPGDRVDVTARRRDHRCLPRHRRAPVRQIQVPGENHLRRGRLRGPAPDNVRRRFRLRHRALPQFHGGIRVPHVSTPVGRPGR